MDELVQINVMVSDRIYPLRIREDEREEVLNAVKLVNEKTLEYQRMYEGKDKQDYLAMVVLLFALEHIRHQKLGVHNDSDIEQQLTHLETLLAAFS
jgi:Cell division protein ZapA